MRSISASKEGTLTIIFYVLLERIRLNLARILGRQSQFAQKRAKGPAQKPGHGHEKWFPMWAFPVVLGLSLPPSYLFGNSLVFKGWRWREAVPLAEVSIPGRSGRPERALGRPARELRFAQL